MKAISLVLSVALAVSYVVPALSQDKPQQDAPPAQTEKKVTHVKVVLNLPDKLLKTRVEPIYPQEAKEKRIHETVSLHVIIAKDGSVQQVEAISGHPIFVAPAIEAVRQWKFRPIVLNGEPVEVDTTVDIIFSL